MVRRGIPGEMEQNLIKEAIQLHLLSALSEAGVLRHVVFQGGTALRLCYGGERYSEDLDFVCGKAAVVTASARILPDLIAPIAKVPSMTMKSSVPSSTSGS
ncbi:MAG: nucleotidyl transferase AbiEii/AbiGii toxin family protein, partial [Xanthobacteraceae bacterium]